MTKTQVRERLDQLIQESNNEDYNSVSSLIGKNHAYIQQFIKRGIPKKLKDKDCRIIAQHFNVPYSYLNPKQGMNESREAFSYEQKILSIPYYDIGVSAGAGSIIEGENPIGTLPFNSDHIQNLGVSSTHLAVLKVRGDSMFPTLNDGDDILIDTSNQVAIKDGIYVIRLDEGLMVKRLSINPINKLVTIKSDNTLYETWENCPADNIHLIGRVIWTGRRL